MYRADLMLGLPVELSGEIVGRWLYVDEIARLDSAFCQTEAREILHRTVFISPSCIINNVSNRDMCFSPLNRRLNWIALRGIRVEHVTVSGKNNLVSEQYLRMYGKYITSVHLNGYYPNDNASMTLIPRYCENLRCVEYCSGFVRNSFMQLLNACPRLESLKVLHSYGKQPPITVETQQNSLRLHSLDLYCEDVVNERILSMCVSGSVRRLKISHDECISDWSQFTTLRSLDLSECTPTRHTLAQILDQCVSIVNLNASRNRFFDSELGGHMPPLRSLNLENGGMDSESQLLNSVFVQKQKHTLEALYVCGCEGLAGNGINLVLADCPNLRTLSFDFRHTVDYTLMRNLTTLIIDCFEVDDTWGLMQQHCRSLQYLHVIFKYIYVPDLTPMIVAVNEMSSLRMLYFVGVRWEHHPACIDAAAELRVLRPSLFIEENEDEGAWYDLFKLPI